MNPIGAAIGGAIGEARGVAAVFTIAGAVILAWGVIVAPAFLRPDPLDLRRSGVSGLEPDPPGHPGGPVVR
jgi:hypothetical protein